MTWGPGELRGCSPYPCEPPWKEVPEPIEYRGFVVEWDRDEFIGTGTTQAMLDAEASVCGPSVEACCSKIDDWWTEEESRRICQSCNGVGRGLVVFANGYRWKCSSCDGHGTTAHWREIEPLS